MKYVVSRFSVLMDTPFGYNRSANVFTGSLYTISTSVASACHKIRDEFEKFPQNEAPIVY